MNKVAFVSPGVFGARASRRYETATSSTNLRFNSSFLSRRSVVPMGVNEKVSFRRARRTPICSLDPTFLSLSEAQGVMTAITLTEIGLNLFNFVMVVRIILSWYPQTRLTEQPWIYVAAPTEPLLSAMRKVVKPVGGVDISPIVWFAIGSFLHEILVGQQGLLILVQK